MSPRGGTQPLSNYCLSLPPPPPAFQAALAKLPAWQQRMAKAEAEGQRISALLDPSLRPGAADGAEQDEGEEGLGLAAGGTVA